MKNLSNFLLIPLLFTVVLISACKKDKKGSGTNVYIAGLYVTQDDTHSVACYWKNGEVFSVPDSSVDSRANDIMVKQGNVYLAGRYNNKPCVWKNGILTILTTSFYDGSASKFEENDPEVSIGYVQLIGNATTYPTLWIGATQIMLEQVADCFVSGVVSVSGNYVMSGSKNGIAGYWEKNGNQVIWHPLESVESFGIGLKYFNNELYVFGYKLIAADYHYGYWKSGAFVDVGIVESEVRMHAANIAPNGDIFFVGYSKLTGLPVYVKNTQKVEMPDFGSLLGVEFRGNDFYFVADGQHYYKNGAKIPLAPKKLGAAKAIFLQ